QIRSQRRSCPLRRGGRDRRRGTLCLGVPSPLEGGRKRRGLAPAPLTTRGGRVSLRSHPSTRMRGIERFHEADSIHLGVKLRGGQGSVAQEFLDAPQVPAARQQMRGEGVAQGVWGGAVRQAEG